MMAKGWVIFRSFVILVAIGVLMAYLNDLGDRVFPRYEKYVDNVVALIMIIPLVYLVLVPMFRVIPEEAPPGDDDRNS